MALSTLLIDNKVFLQYNMVGNEIWSDNLNLFMEVWAKNCLKLELKATFWYGRNLLHGMYTL